MRILHQKTEVGMFPVASNTPKGTRLWDSEMPLPHCCDGPEIDLRTCAAMFCPNLLKQRSCFRNGFAVPSISDLLVRFDAVASVRGSHLRCHRPHNATPAPLGMHTHQSYPFATDPSKCASNTQSFDMTKVLTVADDLCYGLLEVRDFGL